MDLTDAPTTGLCALCGREEELTPHALIPRTRWKKSRTQRNFTREEMKSLFIGLCPPCYSNVHKNLSDREMADDYNTRDKLIEHPAIENFTAWIRKKPPGFRL